MYYSEITKNQCQAGDPGALLVPDDDAWQSPAPDGHYFEYPATGLPILHAIDQAVIDATAWVESEFENLDDQMYKIQMGDPGAIATLPEWQTYGNELNAYVVDYQIMTPQPTRPT